MSKYKPGDLVIAEFEHNPSATKPSSSFSSYKPPQTPTYFSVPVIIHSISNDGKYMVFRRKYEIVKNSSNGVRFFFKKNEENVYEYIYVNEDKLKKFYYTGDYTGEEIKALQAEKKRQDAAATPAATPAAAAAAAEQGGSRKGKGRSRKARKNKKRSTRRR